MRTKLARILSVLLLAASLPQLPLQTMAYGMTCGSLGHLVDQYLNNAYEQSATSERSIPAEVRNEITNLEGELAAQRDPVQVEAVAGRLAEVQLKNRLYQEAAWTMRRSGHPELAEKITQNLEAKLKNPEVVSVAALGGGITATSIVTLKDGTLAVFKPEDKSSSNSWASHHHNEIAAYVVDRGLGLGIVPVTVEATVNGQLGSLQYFIRGASMGGQKTWRLKLLDALIEMQDRHGNNYISRIGGQNAAIDHGISFGVTYGAYTNSFNGIVPSASVYKRIVEVPQEYWDRELKPLLVANYEGTMSSEPAKRTSSYLVSYIAAGSGEAHYNNFLQRLTACRAHLQSNVQTNALLPDNG